MRARIRGRIRAAVHACHGALTTLLALLDLLLLSLEFASLFLCWGFACNPLSHTVSLSLCPLHPLFLGLT
jgi:hypothetical protein